jgi:hypothetical protein
MSAFLGWPKSEFDWREYLVKTNSEPAPERAFNLVCTDYVYWDKIHMLLLCY